MYIINVYHAWNVLYVLDKTFFVDEIRQDIEDAITHMKPWKAEDGSTYFGGWARMAQPIVGFNVVEVQAKKFIDS